MSNLDPTVGLTGAKARVIHSLSKPPAQRTYAELHDMAQYLKIQVPFFKRFTTEQRVEICRVSELVTLWGLSVLFKQGDIGEAFYVVLSGTVNILIEVHHTTVDERGCSHTDVRTEMVNSLNEGTYISMIYSIITLNFTLI